MCSLSSEMRMAYYFEVIQEAIKVIKKLDRTNYVSNNRHPLEGIWGVGKAVSGLFPKLFPTPSVSNLVKKKKKKKKNFFLGPEI